MEKSASLTFPFDASTPSMARTKLAAFLTRHRVGRTIIDDAMIVLSEMVANAVSHGSPDRQGQLEICWTINGDLLELSVLDAGSGAHLTPIDFDNDSLSGRGLSIINRVSDRWWVDMAQGTRVHAELSID